MQYASCHVKLAGDIGNVAVKAPVTPAEIVMLQAIHGPDAVSNVVLLNGGGNDKASHAEEFARLKTLYTAQNDDGKSLLESVFPGHSPRLPTTFSEIGIAVGANEGKTVKPKGKGKTAVENAAAATQSAGGAGDDGDDDSNDNTGSED